MDEIALEALKGSIAKWEAIVAGTGKDSGCNNCPLCERFDDNPRCSGCPVSDKVGMGGCECTPYMIWLGHQRRDHLRPAFPIFIEPGCDECTELAQAELDFLRDLLPPAA